MTAKIENILMFLLAIQGLFIIGFVILVFQPSYLHYEKMPWPTLKPVYHPGENVQFIAWRCNSSDTMESYTASRQLYNVTTGSAVILKPLDVALPAGGCIPNISKLSDTPVDTPDGFYRFRGQGVTLGIINSRKVDWTTDTFEIKR